ncbi:MAG: hypothetical protein H6735_26080 [Alphaproteobacteria bacterium]|nr:hypothetical protein [Alphaproteobacteria bacterium]
MLALLPISTSVAATNPTWVRTDTTSSLMVEIVSPGLAEGETVPAMVAIPTLREPDGFDASQLAAFDADGRQLPCEVEIGGDDTLAWVSLTVPPAGNSWIWLDWSGSVPPLGGVFANYLSVHHFAQAGPGTDASGHAHTAVLTPPTGTVIDGTSGFHVELHADTETVSIPYTQLLVGSAGWTMTMAISQNNVAYVHPIVTADTSWTIRNPGGRNLTFDDLHGGVLPNFASLPSQPRLLALVYDTETSPTLTAWLEGDTPDSLPTTLNELTGDLVLSGPTSPSSAYAFDELRFFPAPRSQDWLEVDALSLAGDLASPCLWKPPLGRDEDQDGICDEYDACPDAPNLDPGGSDCPTPPEETGGTVTGTDKPNPTDDSPSDTGPMLRLPAMGLDPGCTCDTASGGWATSLGWLLAAVGLRRRRQA